MYIAIKWLTGLAAAMWIAMCCVDMYIKRKSNSGIGFSLESAYKNMTIPSKRIVEAHFDRMNYRTHYKEHGFAVLHCLIFLSGAFAVSVFNKKTEIILYTKNKIAKINLRLVLANARNKCMEIVIKEGVVFLKSTRFVWRSIRATLTKLKQFINDIKSKERGKQRINLILLNKLKEIGQERKNLVKLLIAAIRENKNIRTQYQLESMAKNRLLRHIDDTQKQIKENRSKYVSFQHLYLVTHQENIFLKARIKKLSKEKEEVENNLLCLINEIYRTKNTELKTYCTRFIVQTKDNFLKSNVSEEIQQFLKSTGGSKKWGSSEPNTGVDIAKCGVTRSSTHITELLEDDSLVPFVSDAPKLKGLPGEYVWTVKDKDGIIEKLYEYDYVSDLDNGDTIQRIRQYSVYFDKDCLLDYSSSRTVVRECTDARVRNSYGNVQRSTSSARFLTGSEAFQNFLKDNNISHSPSILPGPPLLCG